MIFAAVFAALLGDFRVILHNFRAIFLWSARARKVEAVRLFKVL